MHVHAHMRVCTHKHAHTLTWYYHIPNGLLSFFSSPFFPLNSMSDKSLSSLCGLLSLLRYLTLSGHFIYSLFEWKGGGDAAIYILYTVKYISYTKTICNNYATWLNIDYLKILCLQEIKFQEAKEKRYFGA